MAIPPNNPNSKSDSEHTPPNRGLNSNPNNGQQSGQSSETGPIEPSNKPGLSETWSTMHMLALDSTKLSGQAQTASLPMGRGMTKVYSTGDIVDNSYRLLSLLGTGGMGVVFHCQHLILGKEYALKLLAADKLSAESWSRFQSEAKALARLHHPGVVGIHNMGIDAQECPYYVMDLLEGESLSQIVKDNRRLPVSRALPIFIQLADALDSAHQQGIIHRDIKPSNVMVLQEKNSDKVKLVDFGIARLSNRGVGNAFDSQNKTAAGTVFGTPYYMSPEQSLGKPVDHRSDIYSLGCALFEALTGVPPFCGGNAFETILMHQTNEAPSLNSVYPQGKFSSSLETAVAKMLRKDVEERYQSMKQVAHDLSRIQEGKSIGIEKSGSRSVAEPKFSDEEDHIIEALGTKKQQAKPSAKTLTAVAAAVLLISLGAISICLAAKGMLTKVADSNNESNSTSAKDTKEDSTTGDFQLENLKKHLKQNETLCQSSVNDAGQPVRRFIFPNNDYLGYIKWGDNPPQKAMKTIEVPKNEKVYLYLQCVCTPFPEICNRFGKDNIAGLEIVSFNTPKVIDSLKSWTALEHLSFSNSLERVKGIDCSTLAVEDLPLLDQLTQLKSLGVAGEVNIGKPNHGHELTGASITKLKLLNSLQALQLQEIKDIQPMLSEITRHPNLKDITLVGLDIDDADLAALAKAKNIETLRIYQCNGITPAAVSSLVQMPGLKVVRVDQTWPAEAKRKLLAAGKSWEYEDYKKNARN